MSKGRVLVAMSGGIDSSVTAALLHNEGYQVIGLTMKTWDYAASGGGKKETGCCSLDSINDARNMAVTMGFPHYIIDIREEFGDHVIENFVDEYLAGRTPNPCVMCNTHIKWEALLRRADRMECDFIATGHYAKVRKEGERFVVSRGLDLNKDQSYVLWGVSQYCLSRTMFPVGGFHKPDIRQMAMDMGFPELAAKPESYEICFIPDNDYRSFLKRRRPELESQLAGGAFQLKDGTKVGEHNGYPFYTIGQRKGLIAMGEPYFVTQIIPETNTVVIGKEEDLLDRKFTVRGLNLLKIDQIPANGLEVLAKIRYKDPGSAATLFPLDNKNAYAIFHEPVKSIAPGQSAVFYDGDDVIGGGWIDRVGE